MSIRTSCGLGFYFIPLQKNYAVRLASVCLMNLSFVSEYFAGIGVMTHYFFVLETGQN